MSGHPIVAGAWLALTVGGLGYLGFQGQIAVHEKQVRLEAEAVEAEARRAEQEKQALQERIEKQMLAAVMVGQSGDFEKALELFRALDRAYPDKYGIKVNLGMAQRAVGKLDEADATFRAILEIRPDDWHTWAERASVKKEQGDVDGALELLAEIPAGEGQLKRRLSEDSIWRDLPPDDPRVVALMKKHRVFEPSDTSIQMLEEMARRQREQAAQP